MSQLTYPFSLNPSENNFPKSDSLIFKRDYIFSDLKQKEINRIEIDQKKLSELFPETNKEDLKELTDKFLQTIVQISISRLELNTK